MAVNRFQVKISGSEVQVVSDPGRIVGWRLEFMSCQPAPIGLIINGNAFKINEGLLLSSGAKVALNFEGERVSTVALLLVLERVG